MTEPCWIAEDRSIAVPPGWIIRTDYVHVDQVKMACRARMGMCAQAGRAADAGDVDRAYQKRLQLGDKQPWPCPRGHWEEDRFVVVDGRHEFIATLMLGLEYILVAWCEPRT